MTFKTNLKMQAAGWSLILLGFMTLPIYIGMFILPVGCIITGISYWSQVFKFRR